MVGQDNNSFAGPELDPETETYHAQFRQYGLAQGSWMSPDPYSGSYDMNNPQSLNRYSYVLNNPLAFTDRLGLDSGFDCGDNCVGVTGTPDPDPCGEDPSFCSPSGPGSPTGNALPLPPIPPPPPQITGSPTASSNSGGRMSRTALVMLHCPQLPTISIH